jgi:hypothetical protein
MSSATLVPPGPAVRVTARSSLACRPYRIIIGMNPEFWIVEDIRLGGQSQIAGAIPGLVFAPHSISAGLIFPVGVVQPVQDLEITVRYVGDAPAGAPFIAAMFGETSSDRDPVTRIGRRFVARWTPEGRFEPWMAVHLPGRDQVTGEDNDSGPEPPVGLPARPPCTRPEVLPTRV